MINSMTAYASAEKTENNISVNVEIRSYNHRYLDIVLRLGRSCRFMENDLKKQIAQRVSRGRMEVKIHITDDSDEAAAYTFDEPKAEALNTILLQLKERFQISGDISLEMFTRQNGLIRPAEKVPDEDAQLALTTSCLDVALDKLTEMRRLEGAFLSDDFNKRIGRLETYLQTIQTESQGLFSFYQERLKERIRNLTEGIVEIDDARIVQEAAFFAEKSDLTEEMVRIKSHLIQFRKFMNSPEPAGRKLNFLLQELNREFNTTGSKTEKANVAHTVVDAKAELEKLREQVQNVE
jgi:uncharacterized protein (TIGR00255 family)